MRRAQIGRHGLGVVEVGDGRGEVMLPRQQDVLGAAGEIGLVFLGQRRNGEGVPAEGVGVPEVGFQLAANGGDPDQVQARSDERHVPEGGVIQSEGEVTDDASMRQIADRQILAAFGRNTRNDDCAFSSSLRNPAKTMWGIGQFDCIGAPTFESFCSNFREGLQKSAP